MAGSISQQLEELLNPLPKFVDPEDDQDEETKAKIELFDEGDDDDGEDGVALSGLRKQATALLPETDRRYLGKATSRKELQREMEGSGEEEDDDDDEEEEEVDEDAREKEEEEEEEKEACDAIDEDENDVDDDNDDDDEEDDELGTSVQNGLSEIRGLVSKMKRTDITLPTVTDFQKLTEGMDDLGDSEEEDGESEEEEDGESEEEEDEAEEEEEDDEEDAGAVMTFSKEKVDEEVEKGKAVKDQLALWDQLLEGRIKIQKALVTANQLPQQQTFPEFKKRGGAQFAGALKNSHKALKALQRSLLELQDQLLYQKPDTRPISLGKTWGAHSEDEEIISDEEELDEPGAEQSGGGAGGGGGEAGPPKRKLEMAAYPDFMAKRFAAFQPYRDATLQKWHDKTRLTMGKGSKGFGAFDRSILTQVEQVLMDQDRLLRRTQTRRSEYRVLGRPEASAPQPEPNGEAEGEAAEQLLKANSHLKDLDEEIFDDDDFYHQLLRELIERKTSAADPNDQVAMGRQWLAIQKLRSKIKKKVDTKASKGRKVRFHIHSKLLNFMAPIDHSSMNDDARTELYRSMFGKNSFSDGAVPE